MPDATNAVDGVRIYYEDDGGEGTPVGLYGGFFDSVEMVRELPIAAALPRDEFRPIFIDHRGLGRSDTPHEASAYRMSLRAADAVAVLDALAIERAHFIGASWGGRLCFGIGEHVADRVRSLVIGGQQPYEWRENPTTLAVTRGLETGTTEAAIAALEEHWDRRIPEPDRSRYAAQDPEAMRAAWTAALGEGAVSPDLRRWRVPCFIFMGEADSDFIDQARQAADEIPGARFYELASRDHLGAHLDQGQALIDEILRWLRDVDSGDGT